MICFDVPLANLGEVQPTFSSASALVTGASASAMSCGSPASHFIPMKTERPTRLTVSPARGALIVRAEGLRIQPYQAKVNPGTKSGATQRPLAI